MATVSRDIPERPHLDIPKREARALLNDWRAKTPEALDRVRSRHPKFRDASESTLAAGPFRLADAQLVLAREYGFSNWTELKQRFQSATETELLETAIHKNDRETAAKILKTNPSLLHIPLSSGNWGPPMSHAANLGRLEMVEFIDSLGARDHQHAFDRAILQGKLECARWLHAHGAKLAPGLVMGPCETLSVDGLRFLAELNAPFTDDKGDPLAPVGLVLGTYGRAPKRKHAILDLFAERGFKFPDTPMVAFHRGDVARLNEFLRRDKTLVHRRFSNQEIYPPELGCINENPGGAFGMHGTTIVGTTLVHLAIDFDELEIFNLLLEIGADPNARAEINPEGFGGHTPLFNAVISCASACGKGDPTFAQALMNAGADPTVRATIRKFLDWRDKPGWHEAENVTPAEWAKTFPDQGWVNTPALQLIEGA